MKFRGRFIILALIGVLGLIAVSGCGNSGSLARPEGSTSASTEPPALPDDLTYIGHTSDGKVAVAVAVNDGKATAYICDGESIQAWMRGGAVTDDGTLKLTGKGDAELTASVAADALSGRVRVNGTTWSFSAALAEAPAGLYRGEGTVNGESAIGGWIVLPDGRQVGMMSVATLDLPMPPLPFPPDCPPDCDDDEEEEINDVTVDGGTLEVRRISGTQLAAS